MKLSPIDHIFTGEKATPIEFLFVFKNRINIKALERGLNRISEKFWPIFGRLREIDQGKSFEVFWKKQHITIKEVDLTDQDIPNFENFQQMNQFSRPVYSVPGSNLYKITLFQLKNGSALGVNISHCIVDGYSYFYFMSFWANEVNGGLIKRIGARLFHSPHHKRSKLSYDVSYEKDFSDNNVCTMTGASLGHSKRSFDESKCSWKFYDFKITEVWKKIDEFNKGNPQDGLRVSSNDVLCALLVKKLSLEKNFFPAQARLAQAFDCRRVLSELGLKYFGNAVRAASFEISSDEIANISTKRLSKLFRKTTDSMIRANVEKSIAYLEGIRLSGEDGLKKIQTIQISHPEKGFLITNLSRIPLEHLNFRAGSPFAAIVLTPAPRTGVISKKQDVYRVRVNPPIN